MTKRAKDKELGMGREITRRDFLNGVAIGVGGTLVAGKMTAETLLAAGALDQFAPEKVPDYYPPAKMGLRGNHDGSFTFAHRLRDGEGPDSFGDPADTGEKYDLVVVGGGISGLAAAYFYRKSAGKNARILILDNHDDFGGHAKSNEFRAGGRTLLSYDGTQSIGCPGQYSDRRQIPAFRDRYQDGNVLQSLRPEVLLENGHRRIFRQGNVWRRPPRHRNGHHAMAAIPL
jgi:spermidine dehydrogenase